MGAEPYFYFVPYQSDIRKALQELRVREFNAGRYNPAMPFPADDPEDAPGAMHDSIDAARAEAAEDGTRSILDIDNISATPEFCAACPVPEDTLLELYGTAAPTREMVEENDAFLDDLERGFCVYVVVYREQKPHEIYLGGFSFD